MQAKISYKEKLRALAKDEDSFIELLELFESNSSTEVPFEKQIIDLYKSGLPNVFWFLKDAESGEFIFYSDSVEIITGYKYSDLVKMQGGILSLIEAKDHPMVKEQLTKLYNADKDCVSFNYSSRRKDGQVLFLSSTICNEKDNNDKVILIKGITFDITPIKTNEQESTDNFEKMKMINLAKDRFISIVSHDLRSPFTSLLGFSEILLNDHELTDHEKREYLEYIHEASKTQLQMVNYLLDWSKLQTGKLTIDPKRVNLNAIITNCVSVLTGAAIRKDVEINVDVPNEFYVKVDERLINQAVTNLLSNAIKFTPSGKKVFVTATNFKEGMLEIVFKDEGVGISDKNQARLFKIDQKFSLQGTNGERGSGLGLTLVKEIVEKHSGNIWFYSKENDGSEFHITLPGAKNSILIVEDEETVRELYATSIKKVLPGYEIIIVENGYEAIGVILESLPRAIITDHSMPLMNGIQLVQALKKRHKNYIPIIVLSSYFNDDLKQKYKDLGVNNLINKPVNLSDLGETVSQIVASKQ